ncbi:MAG: heavy metal translocating P-type ATPase metal-binding domain-containing protein [Bacteroidota bacterium]
MESTHTPSCYHCGDECPSPPVQFAEKDFCCEGCKMVYQILHDNELETYYQLENTPGQKLIDPNTQGKWDYLEQPEVIEKLIDFTDGERTFLRLRIPQMHCTSCIWLLENLYRLHPGIEQSEVDFLRKTLSLSFQNEQIRLREVIALLAGIGYEPEIRLQDLKQEKQKSYVSPLVFPLGIAGFCFGNIMLFSFPDYLGAAERYLPFFAYLNLLLALPVFFYSSRSFFRSAWEGLKQKQLNIDVPISLGILVLFGRSLFEIISQSGAGYMDSLAGLVFFLLIGKWFQEKTYDQLAFDRDYTAYFPIAATRLVNGKSESVPVTDLVVGDKLLIRNQELIPADARLLSTMAQLDYSFVTGESEPVPKVVGDQLYGGGRQVGLPIEVELTKAVSQSYLTQLWNQSAFRKEAKASLQSLTDQISKRFTLGVLLVAFAAGLYWWITVDAGMAVNVFTAVLIVACPCGIALTLPITLGNTLRLLGKHRLYLKNTSVIEQMASLDNIVFDKTGTLTQHDRLPADLVYGQPSEASMERLMTLVQTSTHPVSQAIGRMHEFESDLPILDLKEIPGQGLEAIVDGYHLQLGSWDYVQNFVRTLPPLEGNTATQSEGFIPHWREIAPQATCLVEDGKLIAGFAWQPAFREGLASTMSVLREQYQLQVLSGDTDRDRAALQKVFELETPLHFQQSPQAKLDFIAALQSEGHKVMMVGDGLNDAGALRQSEVGVALTEDTGTFAPACDAILDAQSFWQLPAMLRFSHQAVKLVRYGFVLSLLYNLFGLAIAVQAWLTPVIAAILMPLSSLTVVAFGMISTSLVHRALFRPLRGTLVSSSRDGQKTPPVPQMQAAN